MRLASNQAVTLDLLLTEITELKKTIIAGSPTNPISADWIPRSDVMKYFNYKDTQIAALEKSNQITVAKVGKRKFIHRQSIIKLIESNIQTV